jgi:hypothetical protein
LSTVSDKSFTSKSSMSSNHDQIGTMIDTERKQEETQMDMEMEDHGHHEEYWLENLNHPLINMSDEKTEQEMADAAELAALRARCTLHEQMRDVEHRTKVTRELDPEAQIVQKANERRLANDAAALQQGQGLAYHAQQAYLAHRPTSRTGLPCCSRVWATPWLISLKNPSASLSLRSPLLSLPPPS